MADIVDFFDNSETKEQADLLRERLQQVRNHRVFGMLKTLADVQLFMSWHVYAVWDFMSLLKSIQRIYTPSTTPWSPQRNRKTARLINEIVLAEESDVLSDGVYCSHYEMYILAMKELGVSTDAIENTVVLCSMAVPVSVAITRQPPEQAVIDYVKATFDTVAHGVTHELLGSFLFGREDAIPGMFRSIIDNIGITKETAPTFFYYLDRHIELDEGEHAPAAAQMLLDEVDGSIPLMILAMQAGIKAIDARIALWDALAAKLESTKAA